MKAEATRTRVIEEGLNALSQGGLAAVTIGRLAEATGLSKSGLFAHFRSREALELALLEETVQLANHHVVEPAMRNPAGLARLMALVGLWFGWSARAGLRGGCPIAAALFELDDVAGPVRDRVVALETTWRALLRTHVQQAVDLGHLHVQDVDQVVWELCGIYLAHHSSMRFHRDPEADRRAQNALVALLRRSGADPANL
ncbi:TetR/AcrR family transcriptional regulator [Sphingomonas sp. R-74633]|uniref:TetR/AcrR family transcriptional regulator n=1 Tax=Sphingomonas sp. R-74633 TaxID=2751188 RepID=UPI0015D17D84|nr:TetR/AcrR family transcriptional regulator [Sphingomonas sp. R-74633]NYT40747.1 TetR/AcrR family transcriptional regulator [Sphingomonas sp. R-74633]